jgi:hypothetical protein
VGCWNLGKHQQRYKLVGLQNVLRPLRILWVSCSKQLCPRNHVLLCAAGQRLAKWSKNLPLLWQFFHPKPKSVRIRNCCLTT